MKTSTTALPEKPDRHRVEHSFETGQDRLARSLSKSIKRMLIFARLSGSHPAVTSGSRSGPSRGEARLSPWEFHTERDFAQFTSSLYLALPTREKMLGLALETLSTKARLDLAKRYLGFSFFWSGITAYDGGEPASGPDFVESYNGRTRSTECKNSNGRYYLSQYTPQLRADNFEVSAFRSHDATKTRMNASHKTFVTFGHQITEFPLNQDGSVKRRFRGIYRLIVRSIERFIHGDAHVAHLWVRCDDLLARAKAHLTKGLLRASHDPTSDSGFSVRRSVQGSFIRDAVVAALASCRARGALPNESTAD